MAFADNIALLRDPGDNALAPSIYDDLLSDYDSQVSLAEGAGAKVAEYEAMVAELTETVARLKSHNYDLLMQIGTTPDETPDDTPDDAAEESGGVDDLFTSEDD